MNLTAKTVSTAKSCAKEFISGSFAKSKVHESTNGKLIYKGLIPLAQWADSTSRDELTLISHSLASTLKQTSLMRFILALAIKQGVKIYVIKHSRRGADKLSDLTTLPKYLHTLGGYGRKRRTTRLVRMESFLGKELFPSNGKPKRERCFAGAGGGGVGGE